jgi:tetratricopeptide (TPR) repeat protein
MSEPLLFLTIGAVYVSSKILLSLLKREGFSRRFAAESSAIMLLYSLAALAGLPAPPVAFLAVLYFAPLRCALLVDLGNAFARRGRFESADGLYDLALKLRPDRFQRQVTEIDRAACRIKQGALDDAAGILRDVLDRAAFARLGLRYVAACHYNLGIVFRRKGQEPEAEREFRRVLEIWPVSEVARHASRALAAKR